jgi:Ca2+-binding EF-hand superfamily protein
MRANDLGEGKIKFTDFLAATLDLKKVLDHEHIWSAFSFFDTDRDGLISGEEIRKALERANCSISDEELTEILGAFDLNSDSNIDFEEFKKMIEGFVEVPVNCMASPVHLARNVSLRWRSSVRRSDLDSITQLL